MSPVGLSASSTDCRGTSTVGPSRARRTAFRSISEPSRKPSPAPMSPPIATTQVVVSHTPVRASSPA
jgi:hypothetical protein